MAGAQLFRLLADQNGALGNDQLPLVRRHYVGFVASRTIPLPPVRVAQHPGTPQRHMGTTVDAVTYAAKHNHEVVHSINSSTVTTGARRRTGQISKLLPHRCPA